MHIQHITLRVSDIEASKNFYQQFTELKIAKEFTHETTKLCFLTNGEGATEVELVCTPGGEVYSGKGMFICFNTDAIDTKHEQAVEMGLNPSPIREPGDGSRYFYVYDPDGVSIQLRSF